MRFDFKFEYDRHEKMEFVHLINLTIQELVQCHEIN